DSGIELHDTSWFCPRDTLLTIQVRPIECHRTADWPTVLVREAIRGRHGRVFSLRIQASGPPRVGVTVGRALAHLCMLPFSCEGSAPRVEQMYREISER